MCGRYALHTLIGDLREHFGLFSDLDLPPRYNISPSYHVPIVRQGEKDRELALCNWGLIPSWSKSLPKTRPINARAETIAEKPYFRSPFKRRRCVVPANGFYEWKRTGKEKQPFYIKPADADLLGFAGVWDRWEQAGETMDTFAIITTSANDTMKPIHDRMPVILDPEQYELWFEVGGTDMLRPYAGKLVTYPISRRVNSPANDSRELLDPV